MENGNALAIAVFREDGKYVGQCVDFDICTQADDMETLKERMDCLIECELEEARTSGQSLDTAPERFHKMWCQGSHTYKEVAA